MSSDTSVTYVPGCSAEEPWRPRAYRSLLCYGSRKTEVSIELAYQVAAAFAIDL